MHLRLPTSHQNLHLKVQLNHQVKFGEHVALLGSSRETGSWKKKVSLEWSESGWTCQLNLGGRERLEYKFVVVKKNNDFVWEEGPNRVLNLPDDGNFELTCKWNATGESNDLLPLGEARHEERSTSPVGDESAVIDTAHILEPEVSHFVGEWRGKAASFMRSNEHNKVETEGKWDVSGLEGTALRLVRGDQHARNWWRKLEVIWELVADHENNGLLEILSYSSIYLKWINTGQIPCFEDGGHRRPNRPAEISREIFCMLEGLASPNEPAFQQILIRKIHPCLPSFKAEFTAAVPLTRIRDIAHRGDIPHELKQEIKHTIQNKLHRNAGPEDLVATEAMLARITSTPLEYSREFVEQFRIFHKELKDFFNAGSLVETLSSLRDSLDANATSSMDAFLKWKGDLDHGIGGEENLMKLLIGTMKSLSDLREALVKGLESGARSDAPDTAMAMRQKWRLCEIGLEDYSFVLLSRFVNSLDSLGGARWLSDKLSLDGVNSWDHSLTAFSIGILQVSLSGYKRDECGAIRNEIRAWKSRGGEDDRLTWTLRLKATLDRSRRLTDEYSDTLLQILPRRAEILGNALGVPANSIKTYAEAEIRAGVIFQVSKLCTLLLKASRYVLGLHGWDIVVPGTASGTLTWVEKMDPTLIESLGRGPIILVVRTADGDEDVATGGPVSGIILMHELPHLSHLGVRAREQKLLFVTCQDDEVAASISGLAGKHVTVKASPASGVTLTQSELETASPVPLSRPLPPPRSRLGNAVRIRSVIPVSDADVLSSGAKSVSCRRLASLSTVSPVPFRVPASAVIPFGSMESALSPFRAELDTLVRSMDVPGTDLETLCDRARSIVSSVSLPPDAASFLEGLFPWDARLIVRSSANVEDLAGISAAGLYESVPNVSLAEFEVFRASVSRVWASLYTRRAVLSRRAASVPQADASMAVLVQEMLLPDFSFVLHTVSPGDGDRGAVEAEISPGLGETLASGTRGTPWRLSVRKSDGDVRTLAFANFSQSMVVGGAAVADASVGRAVVDYSKEPLSIDLDFRCSVGRRLASLGSFLEGKMGCPQDVEGCFVGNDMFAVQTRPQPL